MARPVAERGKGRERVIEAATRLFCEHGVSGTSLQMIADDLGVTKAAVYYQFQSKEALVLACVEAPYALLDALVTAAEQVEAERRRAVALEGFVALVLQQRRFAGALRTDPVMDALVQTHPPYRAIAERLAQVLIGADPPLGARVALSVAGAGLLMAGGDPDLTGVDEDDLQRELLRIAHRILE